MARKHSAFRPCIDLHDGKVKQIVGGTLSSTDESSLKTNFVATCVASCKDRCERKPELIRFTPSQSPSYFADLYKRDSLRGGHVIKLGPGNDDAAREALAAWPGGLQIGGGITDKNAQEWLDYGASKVIVTSFLFPSGKFSKEKLENLVSNVGKERLVIDISCRRRDDKWMVAMNKWQDITDMEVNEATLKMLSEFCSEFLVHAADVEGLCKGVDEELVEMLGKWTSLPTTYAGGAKDLSDLSLVDTKSGGRVDLTYGSALDIFGGSLVRYEELVYLSRKLAESNY